MKPSEIYDIYKEQKGDLRSKIKSTCLVLNINLKKLTRKEMVNLGGVVSNKWNGCLFQNNQMRLRTIVDEYDLFTFFHELGHWVIHWDCGKGYIAQQKTLEIREKEANEFAFELYRLVKPNTTDWQLRLFAL